MNSANKNQTHDRLISICFAGIGICGTNALMGLKESMTELEKRGFKNNKMLLNNNNFDCLGAGRDLESARKMGEKHFDDFKRSFENANLVLVVTSVGEAWEQGIAPFVAKAAKEAQCGKKNTLTICVATMPSDTEADKREKAMLGMEELKKHVDALIVIDSRFQIVLQSIIDTVISTKRNIDFADVCSTLKACGEAIITTVEADSENIDNIKRELEKAINDKPLINHSNKAASRLLIYHFHEEGYSERKHYEVVSEVQKLLGWTKQDGYYRCILKEAPEDDIKFLKIGNCSGEEYKGKTKLIVMAGGFRATPMPAKSPHL